MTDDVTTTGTKTFTQQDVDRAFAAGAQREREKLGAKYADYDDLKAQAAEAGKSKSAIERLEAKFDEANKRAEKAEEANIRREVADELGLTAKQARRLTGKTREELLADGRDYIEDNGIKPKSKDTNGDTGTNGTNGDTDDGKQAAATATDDADDRPTRRRQRPTETLRSGAPATAAKPEETDPLKLVENVRRF